MLNNQSLLGENLNDNIWGEGTDNPATTAEYNGRYPAMVISMVNDNTSSVATRKVIQSIKVTESELDPFIMPATTPDNLDEHLSYFGFTKANWTYPSEPYEQRIDINSGLTLTGYNAVDVNKVISCMVSHMRIWRFSAMGDIPFVVLEHDAVFNRKFVASDFPRLEGGIIGLNDPRGATRKGSVYLDKIINANGFSNDFPTIKPAPYVDYVQTELGEGPADTSAPQGLAGNSAYLIYPNAAGQMLELVNTHGLWPNDALMCKQLVPYLRHAYPFYTGLQGVASTTQN